MAKGYRQSLVDFCCRWTLNSCMHHRTQYDTPNRAKAPVALAWVLLGAETSSLAHTPQAETEEQSETAKRQRLICVLHDILKKATSPVNHPSRSFIHTIRIILPPSILPIRQRPFLKASFFSRLFESKSGLGLQFRHPFNPAEIATAFILMPIPTLSGTLQEIA